MGIRKTRSGKWQAYVSVTRRGERYQPAITCDSYRKAKKAEAELEFQYNVKKKNIGKTKTLHEVYSLWERAYRLEVSDQSYYNKTITAERHIIPWFGDMPLEQIARLEIKEFFLELSENYAKGTLQFLKSTLNMIFEYAIECQIIAVNPVAGLKIKHGKVTERKTAYAGEQINKVFPLLPRWLYNLAWLSLNTGMRRGEVCGLEWPAINLKEGIIEVKQQMAPVSRRNLRIKTKPKTESGRRLIPITSDVIKFLKELRKWQLENNLFFGHEYHKNSLVITMQDGKPIAPASATTIYSNKCKEAGVPTGLHRLRHTYATRLYRAKLDRKARGVIMGHASPDLTDNVYTHMDKEMIQGIRTQLEGINK